MNIIELAKQANGEPAWSGGVDWTWEELAKFADLVEAAARADEREARAKFFDDNDINLFWGSQVARHIRARGTT